MAFLDDDTYLLTSEAARRIYKQIKDLPILDAHNHADVREIAENNHYTDIWQVEAATDHYVWELMRKRGVPERLITGDATNKEKWMALAGIFEDLGGNPTYEWIHLDLKRRFGINDLINPTNAEEIWIKTKEMLEKDSMRPRAVLREMNVEVMCSTDDPIDPLEHHEAMQDVEGMPAILPTWRPDKAMNIFKEDYPHYITKLSKRVQKEISTVDDLVDALQVTHDYFEDHGTKATDHGVRVPFGYEVSRDLANAVFEKRMAGKVLEPGESRDFMSYMMHRFGEMNARSGWVMQIHIGAVRDYRDMLFNNLGTDTGGDISDHLVEIVSPLKDFLNAFDGKLKVVLYCLDPGHYPSLATIARAFGKNVNLGAAWWYNDSPVGMQRQLEYISSVDLLMNFAGMVTDSRKLMSYGSRTEMFRRVLSDVLGKMISKGMLPEHVATKIAIHACHAGPKELFGF
ncbi:glucuronate isomerase [Candidatus Bathyarchaeota archaeon]|nr:glucuronate isomerase [Candidatus Bathyarchaeota archaeon]